MTTAGGTRYRIVTRTDDEEHIGSVVLSRLEAADEQVAEWLLHCLTGWNAWTQDSETDGFRACVFEKNGVRRTVDVRAFTPHDDIT